MLDQGFFETLEYKITEALEKIIDEKVKGFWCDGVLISEPDNYYSQKFINDNRQIQMSFFSGVFISITNKPFRCWSPTNKTSFSQRGFHFPNK